MQKDIYILYQVLRNTPTWCLHDVQICHELIREALAVANPLASPLQESHVSKPTRVPPTPVPMVASAYPLSLHTSVAAFLASMAPPAGKMLTSAARPLGCVATEAPATTSSAPIAAPAVPPIRVPTVNCPTCPAAPHPARMGAPAALRETPPTSVPACQVGPISIYWPLAWMSTPMRVLLSSQRGTEKGSYPLWGEHRGSLEEACSREPGKQGMVLRSGCP